MKKAFTLAEVLITLAVIGVVAALTIPTLVQKYQKKQLYTQFMKTYNAIVNSMDTAVAEYGDPYEWNWGQQQEDPETGDITMVGGDNPASKYFYPQFKYVTLCNKASDCFASTYTFLGGAETSSGGGSGYEYEPDITEVTPSAIDDMFKDAITLADGSAIAFGYKGGLVYMFDTNGKKGPNVMGRDLFLAEYDKGDDYSGVPEGVKPLEYYTSQYSGNSSCNPNTKGSESGMGCGARLLEEGAMNY